MLIIFSHIRLYIHTYFFFVKQKSSTFKFLAEVKLLSALTGNIDLYSIQGKKYLNGN